MSEKLQEIVSTSHLSCAPPTAEEIMQAKNAEQRRILDRTPYPGEDNGVFSISREGVFHVDEFAVTQEEVDGMPDVQLPLPEWKIDGMQAEEFDWIRTNAQKACVKCAGHCCLAFTTSYSPKRMKESLEESLLRGRALVGEFQAQGHSESLAASMAANIRESYDLQFGIDNFEPIAGADHRYTGNTYKCRQFDPVARRCLAYEKRPTLCQRFVCGPASAGFAPTGKNMETKHHPVAMALIRGQDIYDPSHDYGLDREDSPEH